MMTAMDKLRYKLMLTLKYVTTKYLRTVQTLIP